MSKHILHIFVAISIIALALIAANQPTGSELAVWADGKAKGLTPGFFAVEFGTSIPLGRDFTEIQVFSSLPPGKYIANANAVLATNATVPHFVDCIFTIGGSIQGELARGMIGGMGPNNFTTLPLTIAFSTNSTQDLGLACRADVEAVVVSQGSPITIIGVDNLTVQGRPIEIP